MKHFIISLLILITAVNLVKADDDRPVTVNELPVQTQEFIKKYFPRNEISFAKMEKDFWDKKYEVVFVNGDKIEFNKKGEWEEINCIYSAVPDTLIPAPIKTHLSRQYPQARVLKIEKDSKGYEVKLNNKLELKFNPAFQLIDIDN